MKDSDAENSTELKSGVIINGTFVTLPPAAIPGHVTDASSSEENKTSGYDLAATTASAGLPVSVAQNTSFVFYELANVTDSNSTYESATRPIITSNTLSTSVVPAAGPPADVNSTASFLDSETVAYKQSSDYTLTPTAAESSMPALLYGEVCYCCFYC